MFAAVSFQTHFFLLNAAPPPAMDWVKLAVTRARLSGMPAVFWLDPNRPHGHGCLE